MNEPTDEAPAPAPGVPLEPRAPSPKAGQRWRDTGKMATYNDGKPFTLTEQDHRGHWGDDGPNRITWHPSSFESGRLAFVDHGEPAGALMEVEGIGYPARCLVCGKDKQGCAYTCAREECHLSNDEYVALTGAWDGGSRDFPRRRPQAASPAPAPEASEESVKKLLGSMQVPASKLYPPPPAPEAPKPKAPPPSAAEVDKAVETILAHAARMKPPLREVSSNGREWIKYDTLVDADPFTSYRWHRELVTMSDGTWTETSKGPAEPRGYNGTWANHTFLDRERRMVMDKRDDEGRPDRGSPPPSHPLQREARATLFGGVWNLRGGGR